MSSAAENNKKNRRMIPLRYVLTPIAIVFFAIVGLIVVAALAPKPAKKPTIIKAPLVEVQDIERKDIEKVFRLKKSPFKNSRFNILPHF